MDAKGDANVVDNATFAPGTHAYTLMEYNFSLFFGLAIQMFDVSPTTWQRRRMTRCSDHQTSPLVID